MSPFGLKKNDLDTSNTFNPFKGIDISLNNTFFFFRKWDDAVEMIRFPCIIPDQEVIEQGSWQD